MKPLTLGLTALVIGLCLPAFVSLANELPEALAEPGQVLILRHALAPGTGDPENIDLSDCSTQRNLSKEGQVQAIAIGKALRQAGVREAKVYTSQWCRTRDTARLLDYGPIIELPALNSFFEEMENEEAATTALRQFLATQPTTGPLVILVTHQVNITALTGVFPGSGDGVLFKLPLNKGSQFQRVVFPRR